ncbi:ABC transporter permease [Peribacillus cavernae]|uniref:Autoinducer 2 import system permease protein LsrC n=1 Tax=Peribacillus cavernae TaxID=1674310 RepID=A0A433HIK8_9BACI|nr:ABC transporter permease [Peribacillus cavernae]MDQ0217721.1 ribose transport system permease protein [Peribacillus cavernae]RUQ28187.1 ABC transporter permease [Peribacillus cavernae]
MNTFKRKLLNWSSFPSLVLIIALSVINSFLIPHFFSMSYISSFLTSYTPLIIVAMAQTFVLLGRGIDLSVGGIISLVNVIVVTLFGQGWSFPSAIAVGILAGIIIGVLNGIVIGFLRVTPLLATLATTSVAAGAALWIMPFPGGSVPIEYVMWYQSNVIGFLPTPLLFIIISILIWFIWKATPAGLQLYSMGRDIQKTYVSGVPVVWIQFYTYVSSGFISAIAAIALTGNTGAGDPLVGNTYTLFAVAAAVIGSVSLMGGSGDIFGAIFGAVFLGLAFSLIYAIQIPSTYQDLTSGVIVLLGIIGASLMKKRKRTFSFKPSHIKPIGGNQP